MSELPDHHQNHENSTSNESQDPRSRLTETDPASVERRRELSYQAINKEDEIYC